MRYGLQGVESVAPGAATDYHWWQLNFLNPIFDWFGWATFDPSLAVVDGYTGATPLALAYQGGWDAVTQVYSEGQILWGSIPGSIGETSKPLILLGAGFLIITGIASWRVMAGMLLGAVGMSVLMNMWGATPFMEVPWYYQLYMGSFFFAMAFMATDPVTAASTPRGKIIYGFLIGFVGMIIRVMNPAYPEGWMLAILLFNTFAPLIDHYVIAANMSKRLKRA